MKKQSAETPKYFRFQLSPAVVVMSAAAILVSLAAIAIAVYNIWRNGIHSFNDVLKYPFLILVGLALLVIVVALLIRSRYIVDDKYFVTQFGLIKSRCELKKITSVMLDRDTYKLTVYMNDDSYSVISVQSAWNEDFVRALLKGNPDIDYSYTVRENRPDNDEKKK